MNNDGGPKEAVLITVIVKFGLGSKVLNLAKQNGIMGGVIFLGHGTLKNRILEFLELADVRREIILMIAEKTAAKTVLDAIDDELELKKPYHGIAFTTPLSAVLFGGTQREFAYTPGKNKYNSIYVVVDKGRAEYVMEAATGVGARGGTVIKGKGSGNDEISKLFEMDIEPEKEIVLILSEVSGTQKIIDAIYDRLEIEKPGKGIIFCHDVDETYGMS